MQMAMRLFVLGWLLSLPLVTKLRVAIWHSDLTLWSDAARKAPEKSRPTMNLGRAYELAGDEEAAKDAYQRAISFSFDPRRSEYDRRFTQAAAETNLAHLFIKQGRVATAMQILDMTLQQWPEFPYAHYNRGSILWAVGACEQAWEEYAKATFGAPELPMPKGTCVPAEEGQ